MSIGNKRILIVDDNPSLHEDFKKILVGKQSKGAAQLNRAAQELFGGQQELSTQFECELDFAFQGEEACLKVAAAQMENRPYALVFMDVRMPPGWDGVFTIEKIWEKAPYTEVVLCTAYSDYSLDDVIGKLGTSDQLLFIKKPFDSVEIIQTAISKLKKWNLGQESRRITQSLQEVLKEKTLALDEERARGINNAKLVALGEMAGGIAHEINNPLAIILSNIGLQKELLLEKPVDMAMLVKIAEKIETTAIRIAKVVKGLRAFSRTADNDPMEDASVRQIIQETFGICSEKFKINEVHFIFDDEKVPAALMVQCRSTQIIQVLLNLFSNAYDAIGSQKEKWVRVEVLDSGPEVIISVTDSGNGIPPEIEAKIFRPFFTTKGIGKGTGLGLSISRGIAKDHRGTLKIDHDCPNTRFILTLPKRTGIEETVSKKVA